MDALHPAIGDIPPQGLVINQDVTADAIGLSEADERLAGPLTVQLDVHLQGSTVTVSGTMEGVVIRQCVRCLIDYEDPFDLPVYADYLRHLDSIPKAAAGPKRSAERPKGRVHESVEEEADEEDEMYYYEGDHVDLAPMLREQIILAAPMQPLCRTDCAGLCPTCGQNLNERHCTCPPQTVPSPFRILRERYDKGGRHGGL